MSDYVCFDILHNQYIAFAVGLVFTLFCSGFFKAIKSEEVKLQQLGSPATANATERQAGVHKIRIFANCGIFLALAAVACDITVLVFDSNLKSACDDGGVTHLVIVNCVSFLLDLLYLCGFWSKASLTARELNTNAEVTSNIEDTSNVEVTSNIEVATMSEGNEKENKDMI